MHHGTCIPPTIYKWINVIKKKEFPRGKHSDTCIIVPALRKQRRIQIFEDKLIIEQDPISTHTHTQRQRCPYHSAGLDHLCQEHSKNPFSPPASPRQAPPTSRSPCSNHSGTNCFTVGFSAGRQRASELNDTAQLKIAGENKTLNKRH